MQILETVISGVVQGLTEFLPVSSSGHLVVLQSIFGYREPKVLEDVLLHVGTLFAILIFFWKHIIALFREKRFLFLIIIGTIPIGIVGFFFGEKIELFFANTKVVGISLLITGLWLLAADISLRLPAYGRRTQYACLPTAGERNTHFTIWHALLIGISQAAALVPGISRSGATISTALLLKRNWDMAFRFSFLLSIPAVLGALFYKMEDFIRVDLAELGVIICGSITACLVGIVALWVLRKILFKKKLWYFTIYCWILGLTLLVI